MSEMGEETASENCSRVNPLIKQLLKPTFLAASLHTSPQLHFCWKEGRCIGQDWSWEWGSFLV